MKRWLFLLSWIVSAVILFAGCEKQPEQLMFPENLQINQRVLSWDSVENASFYTVTIDKESFQTQECYFELQAFTMEGGTYNIEVFACGDGRRYSNSSRARVTAALEAPLAHGFDEQGFEYTFIKSLIGYEIDRGTAQLEGEVVLPDTFEGYPVKRTADNMFLNYDGFGTYPDWTTESNCNKEITAVRLPAELEIIGKRSFAFMVRLEEVSIPDAVTSIGVGAFFGCTHLTKVTLSKNLQCILDKAFGNTTLREINLPEGLEIIGAEAFKNEFGPKMYVNGVLISAHQLPSDLASVTIPASVTYLGDEAFCGRDKLSDITFADIHNLQTFGGDVFRDTAWYSEQPDGMIWFDHFLYNYKGLIPAHTVIEIPEGTAVCGNAFDNQDQLEKVIIHTGVKFVGDSIFYGCASLSEVIIHEGIQVIPEYTFYKIKNMEFLELPNGVEIIMSNAVVCGNLQAIVFPATLKEVEMGALGYGTLKHIFYKGTKEQMCEHEWGERDYYSDKAILYYFYSEIQPAEPGNYWHYVDGVPTPWETEE